MQSKIIAALALAIGVASPVCAQQSATGATNVRGSATNAAATTAADGKKVKKEHEEPDIPAVVATGPNAALLNAGTVKDFVKALPNWGHSVTPKKDITTPVKTKLPAGAATRTHHDIKDTPDKIATFAPVDAFWLGAIVQGRGLSSLGSMQEVRVAATKRAPFSLTSNLPGAHSVEIAAPSRTTVSDAISSMLQAAKTSGRTPASVDSLSVADNFNAQQTATDLNLDVSYLSAEVQGSLSVSHTQKEHTVTAAFIERAFTVTADFGDQSAKKSFFNDKFSAKDARKLVPAQIAMNNLPAYVKSITYGRMLIFNLTSTASAEDMKAAISGKFSNISASVSGGASHGQASQNATFKLQVTQFGGPQIAFSKAVPDAAAAAQPDAKDSGGTLQGLGDVLTTMQNYLNVPADPDSMIPISYTVNSLKDDKLAAMPVTTSYDVVTYANNPVGAHYKIHIWVTIDGIGHTSDPYDIYGTLTVDGTKWWEATRDAPVSGPMGGTLELSSDTVHQTTAANGFNFDYLKANPAPHQKVILKLFQHGFLSDYSIGTWTPTIGDPDNSGEYKQQWHDNSNHALTMHLRIEKGEPIM